MCRGIYVRMPLPNDVVVWDLSDAAVVASLASGLPADGLHLFSDEWRSRGEQCLGFVRARVGTFERRIGARSCDIAEVPRQEATRFLEAFHIQGASRLGIVYFGLRIGAEIVGLLSLGRHSRQTAENRIVLDRLCFRSGVQVIGGASRLVKAAILWAKEQPYDEIVTFSDNRLTDGSLYESLGFVLEQSLKPDYCYVKDGKRLSKQSQKKSASGCPEGMTEHEWAIHRGLCRIYDAGKKRWVINLWPGQHETRNELSSKRCAGQHHSGVFRHSHVRGYLDSAKNGRSVYYGSSYELRCLVVLEADPGVASFRRCDAFKGQDGWRNPDLWIEFVDGRSEVWEVKPEDMLSHPTVRAQIAESMEFARSAGAGFRLWTEKDSGLGSDHDIVKWAREYLVGTGEHHYDDHHREVRKRIRQRYYAKIAADKVEVKCDFCGVCHYPLRMTYDRNIKRNGVYVCERRGGYLAGKLPKVRLRTPNPYASDGLKKCSTCSAIRPVEEFSVRAVSWDGRFHRCKECDKLRRDRLRSDQRRKENDSASIQEGQAVRR